ncbi:copper-binding protein, partial [Escherichia coli]
NWPEMTMRFTITPQTKMSEIKTGDKVAFNFVQQGNLSLFPVSSPPLTLPTMNPWCRSRWLSYH